MLEQLDKVLPARARALGLGYLGLTLLSTIGIIALRPWGIDMGESKFSLPRLLLAALTYGAIFWALVWALVYYYLYRFNAFGRRAFIITAAALSAFWLVMWPGLLDVDAFIAIGQADQVFYSTWHGPTSLLAGAVLHHLPFTGAVGWVQVIFFAAALAYAFQLLREISASRGPIIVMCALMIVSVPLIYNLVLVVRETWVAIVTLFLAVECVYYFRDPEWRSGRTLGRILVLGLIAYFIRSESLVYVAVAGVVALGRHVKADGWQFWGRLNAVRLAVQAATPAIAFLVLAKIVAPIGLPGWTDKARYEMSIWIAPVGDVLATGEAGLPQNDLETIYRFAPREHFKDWSSKTFAQKFFEPLESGHIRTPSDAELGEATQAATHILLARPWPYLQGRLAEFAVTNAPQRAYPTEIAIQPTQAFIDSPRAQALAEHIKPDPTYRAIIPDGRRAVENLFRSTFLTPLGEIEWAVLPDILLLLLGVAFFPWQPGLAFASLIVLSRAVPLILLVPEAQSKYFSSLELTLPFLMTLMTMPAINLAAKWWKDRNGGKAPTRNVA